MDNKGYWQITPREEYIMGEKGEIRRIALDRELVEWERKSLPNE